MPSGPQLRAPVQQARHQLSEGRRKLKEQHQQGSPGIQVCARLTDLLDTVVLDIFQAALADLDQQGLTDLASDVTIVPYGGYGRRDVAPFSDVDLMLLDIKVPFVFIRTFVIDSYDVSVCFRMASHSDLLPVRPSVNRFCVLVPEPLHYSMADRMRERTSQPLSSILDDGYHVCDHPMWIAVVVLVY